MNAHELGLETMKIHYLTTPVLNHPFYTNARECGSKLCWLGLVTEAGCEQSILYEGSRCYVFNGLFKKHLGEERINHDFFFLCSHHKNHNSIPGYCCFYQSNHKDIMKKFLDHQHRHLQLNS